jgi:hypothetical protein
MEVLNFASPKWVYMLKLVEKWVCKTRKYKTVLGGAILNYSAILKFCKKITSTIFLLGIDVFKSKVSGGHLEFLRHFVLFLKIHPF